MEKQIVVKHIPFILYSVTEIAISVIEWKLWGYSGGIFLFFLILTILLIFAVNSFVRSHLANYLGTVFLLLGLLLGAGNTWGALCTLYSHGAFLVLFAALLSGKLIILSLKSFRRKKI